MARNPLAIRRAPNLLGTSQGRRAGNNAAEALKNFTKEVRVLASQTLNEAVEDTIKSVEGQSRSLKPTNMFLKGQRKSPPNLIKAAVIVFDHRPEMVKYAFDNYFLSGTIPIDSGDYKDFFQLFVGGQPAEYSAIRFGVRCEIVNTAPYARMLEVGLDDTGKPFVVQTEPHIVERIATQMMKRQWGRAAKIKFSFTDIPDPYILQTNFHMGRNNKPGKVRADRKEGQPINYPTIIVEY